MQTPSSIKFTILLPVHRDARFLPYSIQSVLNQTETSFELFIICDGSPAETLDCARDFAKLDSRIQVFEFAKGQRFGEAHRHKVLMETATGEFVAHIQDDDLWLPNHLDEMAKLLETVDFGNLFHVYLDNNKEWHFVPGHLDNQETIARIADPDNKRFSVFGLSAAGYRLTAYKSLPVGWSPAPDDIWTDLFMWKKFLIKKELKFGSRIAVTSLKFPTPLRQGTDEQAVIEMRYWFNKIQSAAEREHITQTIFKKLSHAMLIAHLNTEIKNNTFNLQNELKQRIDNIHWLQNQLTQRSDEQNAMQKKLKEQVDIISSLEAELKEKRNAMTVLGLELENKWVETMHLQNIITQIYNSLSWKLTLPLRFIKKCFKNYFANSFFNHV